MGAHSLLGRHSCLLPHMNFCLLVDAEVIAVWRETSRGSDVLMCPSRFRRTPLLLFPANLLLLLSFFIASALLGRNLRLL